MIDWQKIRKPPEPGKSYLVRATAVGPIYDVAFFNGRRPDGSMWWTLGNIDLDARSITHWADINEPR
jgi:hypothetical protein